MRPGLRRAAPLVALASVALLPRLYGLGWGLPDVSEEAKPLGKAWDMWGWVTSGRLDPNPHFFNYPSLTIYLHMIVQALLYLLLRVSGRVHSFLDFRALYVTDPTACYLAARAVTVLFAAGTVVLLYLLGRRAGGTAVGVAAALLLAVNPVPLAESLLVEVDLPMTFFVTLGLFFALRMMEAPRARNCMLAGAAAGLAASAKYPGALVLIPIAAAYLFARRGGRAGGAPWRNLAIAFGVALAVFALTSPFVLLDVREFWRDFSTEGEHMRAGHFGIEASAAWGYYARGLVERFLGWPGTLFALAGLVYFAGMARRPWAIVLGAFLIPTALTLGSWTMRGDRYALPLIPAALVLCAAAADALARLLVKKTGAGSRRAILLAAMTLVLAAGPFRGFELYRDRLRPTPQAEARRWIEEHVPAGSMIVSEMSGPQLIGPLQLAPMDAELRDHILRAGSHRPVYAIQFIPMFQVGAERSARFYDPRLYEMSDYILIMTQVRDRYRESPREFARQLAFYDELDRSYSRVAAFQGEGPGAPSVLVYRNPRQTTPFGARREPALPEPLRPADEQESGEESFFYYNMGLNHQMYEQFQSALACYTMALRYRLWRPKIFANVACGAGGCLALLGRTEEARALVAGALQAATNADDRAMLSSFLARLR